MKNLQYEGLYGQISLMYCFYAIGIRRRSLYLLSKSFTFATKLKLSLDEMMIPKEGENQLNYQELETLRNLNTLMLVPQSEQDVLLPRISQYSSDLPQPLRQAIAVTNDPRNKITPFEDRWICIRHDFEGKVGYLCSKTFERDICEYSAIQKTYQENKHSVISLWELEEDATPKLIGACVHQIRKRLDVNVSNPAFLKTKVKLRNGKTIQTRMVMVLIVLGIFDVWIYKEIYREGERPILIVPSNKSYTAPQKNPLQLQYHERNCDVSTSANKEQREQRGEGLLHNESFLSGSANAEDESFADLFNESLSSMGWSEELGEIVLEKNKN
eukprot:g1794.t1